MTCKGKPPGAKHDKGNDGRRAALHGGPKSAAEKYILWRRRHAVEGNAVMVVRDGIGTLPGQKQRRRYREVASFQLPGRRSDCPSLGVARAINEALDPRYAPGKCRTLADMSPGEIAAIEQSLGAKVKRPSVELCAPIGCRI